MSLISRARILVQVTIYRNSVRKYGAICDIIDRDRSQFMYEYIQRKHTGLNYEGVGLASVPIERDPDKKIHTIW